MTRGLRQVVLWKIADDGTGRLKVAIKVTGLTRLPLTQHKQHIFKKIWERVAQVVPSRLAVMEGAD